MTELILDGLKMSSITKITTDRIKKMKMPELEEVMANLDTDERGLLVRAIRAEAYNRIGHIIVMASYRIMQKKVIKERSAK